MGPASSSNAYRAALGAAAIALTAAVCTTFGAVPTPSGRAEEGTARREDQLKAAYLFNFIKFIEWPADTAAPTLTVCFAGAQGVRDALASSVENKKVGERTVAVRGLTPAGDPGGCNMLYIETDSTMQSWQSTLAAAPSLLTVSDAPGFAHKGGVIELFTENNRLRFNINVENAQKARLRISSNLLQLAATVEKGGRK